MNPNEQKTSNVAAGWREAVQRIATFHLSRFWEGFLLAILGAVVGAAVTVFFSWILPPSSPDDADTQQIENVIADEARFALTHDLKKYGDLFADDAWVIEVTTQHVWSTRKDIVERLKPLHFTALLHTPKQVVVARDSSLAFAETTTTFNQDRPPACCNGKEYWQFRKIKGKWKIVSFQYALAQ